MLKEPECKAILECASELFERYGYKKTTIEDIAREAGIGKGSLYLRFSSKEEIGVAWLNALHKDLFRQSLENGPESPAAKIQHFLVQRVMLRFDIFTRHQRGLDEALASLADIVEAKKRDFHEQEAQYIRETIEEGTKAGTLHSDEPISDARSMILATNSLLPYSRRPAKLGSRESVEAQSLALASLLIRALEIKNV